MKDLNLNTSDGVKFILYPDNQPHIRVLDVNEQEEVRVIVSITSSLVMMQLLETSNALDNLFAKKKELHILYFMAARFDRLMQEGDSIDVKVFADLVNYCGFEKVFLYDVHSDVSLALIKNSINVTNKELVESYNIGNSILICPDAGAVKKVGKYFEWNKNIQDVVYCNKSRDLTNGNLTINVLQPEKCEDRNCVIIDDLCDGGGTFIGIAEQIKPKHLTLIVTHGIFSKGFKCLEKYFSKIITSDSCSLYEQSKIVTVVNFKI